MPVFIFIGRPMPTKVNLPAKRIPMAIHSGFKASITWIESTLQIRHTIINRVRKRLAPITHHYACCCWCRRRHRRRHCRRCIVVVVVATTIDDEYRRHHRLAANAPLFYEDCTEFLWHQTVNWRLIKAIMIIQKCFWIEEENDGRLMRTFEMWCSVRVRGSVRGRCWKKLQHKLPFAYRRTCVCQNN